MKTFLFSIVATATALIGFSQPASAAGWGSATTITGMDISGTGFFLYLKTASNQNPDACTNFDRLLIGCTSGYPKISSIAVPNIW